MPLPRDEGQGGSAGVVLPLQLSADSLEDIVYTVPILVGAAQQNLSLQVDTGSSDLWIASTSCSSSSCGQAGGRLYDPSQATQTDQSFSISYLIGNVSGPIVWDQVSLGGYTVPNQALAAANDVQSESLSSTFSGILGLALPLNSIIAQQIPPVTGNAPDGAAFPSNLFSITPTSDAPAAHFLSISLERPGSNSIPSLLGIGLHPSEILSDPSTVHYAPPITDGPGDLFWKASVRAITVYVDGEPKSISITPPTPASPYPNAILDTGIPVIVTSSQIANGIYGAVGISPSGDGQYYLPCTLPINMTITLDDRPEIPLHPLDLSAQPPASATSENCIGVIQANDDIFAKSGSIILGVPFLRNVYFVMAYRPPDASGQFNPPSGPPSNIQTMVDPRLGLLDLTDPTVALQEFHTVRVLNQPLSPSSPGKGSTGVKNADGKLSVGIDVLIGLASFVALCFLLFAGRWLLGRRRVYHLSRASSRSGIGDGLPSEDALRKLRYEQYSKERTHSEYTDASWKTMVADPGEAQVQKDIQPQEEFGYGGEGDATLVPVERPTSIIATNRVELPASPPLPTHPQPIPTNVTTPLLHRLSGSPTTSEADMVEFGVAVDSLEGVANTMAGIGTAARARADSGMTIFDYPLMPADSSPASPPLLEAESESPLRVDEVETMNNHSRGPWFGFNDDVGDTDPSKVVSPPLPLPPGAAPPILPHGQPFP